MSSLTGKIECPSLWHKESKFAKRIATGTRENHRYRNQSNNQLSTPKLKQTRAFEQRIYIGKNKYNKNRLSTIAEQFDRNSNNISTRLIYNRLFNTESIGYGHIFRGKQPTAPNITINGGWHR